MIPADELDRRADAQPDLTEQARARLLDAQIAAYGRFLASTRRAKNLTGPEREAAQSDADAAWAEYRALTGTPERGSFLDGIKAKPYRPLGIAR